jgi:hypothetical protein
VEGLIGFVFSNRWFIFGYQKVKLKPMLIRNLLVLAILIHCWNKSHAQQITPDMDKLNKLLQSEKGNRFEKGRQPNIKNTVLTIPPAFADTLQPVFENALGKVYILPQDNMPMLKPNQEGKIQNLALEQQSNPIPNPYNRQVKPFIIPNR